MSAAHPPPSQEQLTRCGVIWDAAQRVDCEAILYRVGSYRVEVIRDFALFRWENLGHAVQADITRAMLALGKLLRTAV